MLTPLDVAFKQSHLLTHYEIDADLTDILNTPMNLDLIVSLGNDTITNIDFEARFTDNNGFYFRSFTSQFAYQDDYLQNNPGPIFGSGINLKGPNPNPVFDKFEITFNMIENTNCKAQIIDASGRVLFTLIDQVLKQGPHTYSFDAIKLSNGMYYLNFSTGNYQSIKPFIIFR